MANESDRYPTTRAGEREMFAIIDLKVDDLANGRRSIRQPSDRSFTI